jgi:hypothetical protein
MCYVIHVKRVKQENNIVLYIIKSIYKLKLNIQKFKDHQMTYVLELLDKLIVPILNYRCGIWGFAE